MFPELEQHPVPATVWSWQLLHNKGVRNTLTQCLNVISQFFLARLPVSHASGISLHKFLPTMSASIVKYSYTSPFLWVLSFVIEM